MQQLDVNFTVEVFFTLLRGVCSYVEGLNVEKSRYTEFFGLFC